MPLNKEEILTCIEIEPSLPAKKSVIWLHGLGADGSDFVPIVPELQLPEDNIRFIFPHAPIMPITINNGLEMRAWFDIGSFNFDNKIDRLNIDQSVISINSLIEREKNRGIPSSKIILAGFSQGAVIALITGITYAEPLAGVVALSGFLPTPAAFLQNKQNHIPIFLAHGTEDPLVPYALGKATSAALKDAGFPVSWHSYPMAHGVSGDEIADISQWLKAL